MFDRYILARNFNRISTRFGMAKLADSSTYNPSYNISAGNTSHVIINYQTKVIEQAEFGLKGVSPKMPESLPFVRAEGKRNLSNDPYYTGSKAIFLQPEFNNLIRKQRCLVIADAFIIGFESNNPHLVYLRGKQRPFAFAGIWNKTIDEATGEDVYSFAIITTTANSLVAELGVKRMPVILFNEFENRWLRPSTELSEILNMLNPYPTNLMNAYPIATTIREVEKNDISLIQPVGKPVLQEFKGGWIRKREKVKEESHKPTLAEGAWIKPEHPTKTHL
ncbi:MAG: SOS response-associated peptidase family protein [Bacteroidetes bacterium]|nr:SOS response-associated peptidase family protein [Bacteroidota bacterium]